MMNLRNFCFLLSANFVNNNEPQFITAVIGPGQASAILEMNVGNRPLQPSVVAKYSGRMIRKEWKWTGDPVHISTEWKLLNGQHRLHAIVESGTQQKVTFLVNSNPDIFSALDGGSKRTNGDNFALLGKKSARTLSSLLGQMFRYENDKMGGFETGSFDQQQEILVRHPDLEDAVRVGPLFKGLLDPTAAAFLFYQFSRKNKEVASLFMSKLALGDGLSVDNPAYRARDRLITNKNNKGKLKFLYKLAIVIKAWNKFNLGDSCKAISWKESGEKQEEMPIIGEANPNSKWALAARADGATTDMLAYINNMKETNLEAKNLVYDRSVGHLRRRNNSPASQPRV